MVESRYNLKRKLSTVDKPVVLNASHEPTKNETEACEWLKFNKSPGPTVFKKWGETYNIRRKQIVESEEKLYDNWPLLRNNIGSSLVIDLIIEKKTSCLYKIFYYRLNWTSTNFFLKKTS